MALYLGIGTLLALWAIEKWWYRRQQPEDETGVDKEDTRGGRIWWSFTADVMDKRI